LNPSEDIESRGDPSCPVLGDLRRQDPVPEGPRDDLGSLLVAAIPPIGRGRVPGPQAPEPQETSALRPRDVLVDPDVSHFVEEVPASHLVLEDGADVHATISRVAEMTATAARVGMKVDLDIWQIHSCILESVRRPPNETHLLPIGLV